MSEQRYAIWWLCQDDYDAIGTDDTAPLNLPAYIREQYSNRYGRPGRGRLWCADGMPESIECEWPETPLARAVSVAHGGIVIREHDAYQVASLPGIVTDMRVRRWDAAWTEVKRLTGELARAREDEDLLKQLHAQRGKTIQQLHEKIRALESHQPAALEAQQAEPVARYETSPNEDGYDDFDLILLGDQKIPDGALLYLAPPPVAEALSRIDPGTIGGEVTSAWLQFKAELQPQFWTVSDGANYHSFFSRGFYAAIDYVNSIATPAAKLRER